MTRKTIITAVFAALVFAACTREVMIPTAKNLGEVTVESDAGQLPVLINADGIWKATSLSEWISVDDQWHSGSYSIVITYGSNRSIEGLSRPSRTGKVLIGTADGTEADTLYVHQKGLEL